MWDYKHAFIHAEVKDGLSLSFTFNFKCGLNPTISYWMEMTKPYHDKAENVRLDKKACPNFMLLKEMEFFIFLNLSHSPPFSPLVAISLFFVSLNLFVL